MMNTMTNNKLNMDVVAMINGGIGSLGSCDPVGWPNGWDVTQTGPLGSCDPVGGTGPLGSCDPVGGTGPLGYPPRTV